MVLYLTGIDGSGKSTIAKYLKDNVFTNKEVISIWARYQPKIVKFLLLGVKKKYIIDKTKPYLMDEEKYSNWVNFKKKITKIQFLKKVFFTIQAVDYIFQLKKINKKIKKNKDKIIIIDRYYLDFIVDQSLNYGDIENWFFTKYFLKKTKKVDYIIYINVDKKIAFDRKDDIPSLEYFVGRKETYQKYINLCDNAFTIDNNKHLTDTIEKIKTIIQ